MGFFNPNEMADLDQQAVALNRRQQAAETATAQSAAQIGALALAYPHVSPYVTVPLAQSGVTPDSPVAALAAKQEVKRKASRGFGWHSIGDVVTGGLMKAKSIGSAITPDFVGDTLHAAPVKGVARGVFTTLDALPQTIQGAFRDATKDGSFSASDLLFASPLLGASHLKAGFEQTDLAQVGKEAGESFRGGRGVDMGSGYFAGGRVHAEHVQAARAAAPLIDGHATTIGRYLGKQVFHPGSKPYNLLSGLVDASVQIGADPSTYAAGPTKGAISGGRLLAGDASRGFVKSGKQIAVEAKNGPVVGGGAVNAAARAKQIEQAGGVKGALRNTVLPDRVSEWLLSASGQRIVNHLVATSDYNKLRVLFKDRIDSDTLVQLADAKTTPEVYNILGPKLGTSIREKLTTGATAGMVGVDKTPKALIRQTLDNVRLAHDVPGRHIDLHDVDNAVEQLDLVLTNFKAKPEVKAALVEEMARAGDPISRFAVLKKAMSGQQGVLREMGFDAETANRLTRLYDDYVKDGAKYAVDEIGDDLYVRHVVTDGVAHEVPGPHLIGEYVGRAVPLPDARDVRSATSRLGRMMDKTPGIRPTVAGLDFVTQQAFKPLVLLRGAWTVRVVGEEQIRLAASGKSSMFNHPFSHVALASGRKMDKGLTGGALEDTEHLRDALSRGSGNLIESGASKTRKISTNRKRLYERGLPGHARAWADELADLHNDPLARRIASGGLLPGDRTPNPAAGMDGIRDWFFNGVGSKFRQRMLEDPENPFDLSTQAGSDAYVNTVLDRIATKTGGDLDLTKVVATGQHNDASIFDPMQQAIRKNKRAADSFVKDLDARAVAGQGPLKVKGDEYLTAGHKPGDEFFAAKDRFVETMFNTLMSRPTNYLSRSPAFKQFYWQRSSELVGFMSPQAQSLAIGAARDAKVSDSVVRKMEQVAAKRHGELDLDEADELAKGFGLDETRKLLYDLHRKSQFFDINRVIFPFGEAWKEVLTTWAKIGVKNPVVARRAGLTVQGARSADVDGDGRGIFYPDPLTGEEMIAFPFSEEFTGLVTGVPVKMQGSAKGLNVFSQSVLPGFGPVVQLAAGKLLPDDPSFDSVRNVMIPFGENDTTGGYAESLLPAWYKKFQTSGWVVPDRRSQKQERAYNNTVTDVMRYLLSTGDYSVKTPEEQDRLIQAAKHKASVVFVLRGMTQFWAPTAPSTEFVAKDKDGRAMLTFTLAEEYRKLQQADYKTATAKFIDKFGENAFLSTIPKTIGGGATTKEALDFARRNPDVEREYRDVFAYFTKPSNTFDMTAYQRQLDSGQREVRTPQAAIDLANQRIATMIYSRAREKAGTNPSAEGRAWLRDIKDKLTEQYPGYSSVPADMAKTPRLVDELLRAGRNQKLAATDAGAGLRIYAIAREKAQASARAKGLESFDKSPKAAPIRDWLRNIGEALAEEHPDFSTMFTQVLERELGDDTRGVTGG